MTQSDKLRKRTATGAAARPTSAATASASAAKGQQRIFPRRSWFSTLLLFGFLLPLLTVLCSIGGLFGYSYARLPPGRPFSLIQNQTVYDRPSNHFSRWRAPEYIQQYDRYFFQWWNFLVYDAQTNDHWTLVYHTTKYSAAAGFPDYASASLIHRRAAAAVTVAHDSIPLSQLRSTHTWQLEYVKDGNVPYGMEMLSDDEWRIYANMTASHSDISAPVVWDLTFTRVHGMYSGEDNEEANKQHCSVVSTLFGYHSKVRGWIQEGEKRYTIGGGYTDSTATTATGAAAATETAAQQRAREDANRRYRAYAAGSWGCRLPSGYPSIEYPWTWLWLVIPAPADGSREDIGIAMGTARLQLNSTLLGDLYGGFASVGIGEEIISASFADVHHNTSLQLPLTKASTDDYLRKFDLQYNEWATMKDESGEFSVPLVQKYDVETKHYRIQLLFQSRPQEYFRCPVVVEETQDFAAAAVVAKKGTDRLRVFSDFRACGVKTHAKIWKRDDIPKAAIGQKKISSTADGISKLTLDTNVKEGGWNRVIFDGWVDTMNALEYAYEAPVAPAVFADYVKQPTFT